MFRRPKPPNDFWGRDRDRALLSPITEWDFAYFSLKSPAAGDSDESRGHESLQSGCRAAGLRPDSNFHRQPGKDSVLVVRRDQEARNDQLPHLQTGAGRIVLRPHLRADQGLRMLCGKYKRM